MRCACGEAAEFKTTTRTYGHGDCPEVWYIECQCGLRTKEFAVGYNGTPHECKQSAYEIWTRVSQAMATLEIIGFHLRRNDHITEPTGGLCTRQILDRIEKTLGRKGNLI